jgi:Sulfotransferase family
MLVFWKPRLVFLATPKTASTAIEQALESLATVVLRRPSALKHTDVRHYQTHLAPYLSAVSGTSFSVAALMREPRDWLGSWFRYRQREDEPEETSTRGLTFEDFVRAHCRKAPPAFADVGSQAAFLTSSDLTPVDYTFRYEQLADFVHFLEDRLDCEIHLPHLVVSPQADTALSTTTEALLQRTRAADFALYSRISAS